MKGAGQTDLVMLSSDAQPNTLLHVSSYSGSEGRQRVVV